MLRIVLLALLLCIATIVSAQPTITPTGSICTNDAQTMAFMSPTDVQCCYEIVNPTAMNPTQCVENCASSGYNSLYGYFRNSTYDVCVCLSCWQNDELTNTNDFKGLIRYESGNTATSEIRDLAASPIFDVQADLNTNSSVQLVIAPNQTAVIRTSTLAYGNTIQFIAIPSMSGLSLGSTVGFTVRDIFDYNGTIQAAKFRNNSFEISNLAQRYNPAVQYKRQSPSSDSFTYTMKNFGNEFLVVLSSGNEPLASWYYSPIAYNTDDTITTLDGEFTFTLDVESTSSVAYTPCVETQCTSGNVLEVCENQNLIERKFCHLGCDYNTRDCLQCNSTTCQGTCSVNSTCVCSDTQVGAQCEIDLSTTTFHLSSYIEQSGGTLSMPISAQFDLENCAVGNVCGTLSYVIPSISYMGIINLSGSCCTAPLRLEEIRRSTESQSSATLVLVQENEWTCFQGDLTIDAESLDDVYDLTVNNNGGYNVYNSWQWNYGSMSANEGSQATCDGEGIDQNSSNKAIPALVIPVGVTFLVVSCVAVAGGFVGGFFKSPRGMTVKKREYKGCLPKGNAASSRSIIAIVSVDVGVVSTMNLVGALLPVSAMVLVSGILLAIMTYQYEHVGTRFNNKFRRLYQLQQVERVFGRMGAAFLIIIGIFLLLNEIVGIVGGVLGLLSYFFVGVIGWFYLALYITWAFVAVHFAGAIYISVCYYYTAARTDEQESIQDHKMEMDGHNETEP